MVRAGLTLGDRAIPEGLQQNGEDEPLWTWAVAAQGLVSRGSLSWTPLGRGAPSGPPSLGIARG